MPDLGILDELGIRRVTDKSSLQHDYLTKYERLFTPFRDAPITLLEIGVFNGGSLRLWEDYFPRATIVGVDIQEACKQYEGGRRVVEIASQDDATAMAAIGRKYSPAIVIDDGSHRADHILTSFEAIYPTLRQGGIYIVEDLAVHTGTEAASHRGAAPTSPQDYFLRLANYVCSRDDPMGIDYAMMNATEAVEFLYCLAVIRKKAAPDPDRIERRRALLEEVGSHENWGWFAGYVVRHGGRPEAAVAAANRAVAMAPSYWGHYVELSQAQEFAGKLEEALAAAEEVVRLMPGHPAFAEQVRRIARKIAERHPANRPDRV